MEWIAELAKEQGLVAALMVWLIVDMRWIKRLLEDAQQRIARLEDKVG